jgi:hypothetical protein
MKKIVLFLFSAFLFLATMPANGQDLTGIWRGYFITGSGDQYKYEIQLDQKKNKGLSGVTYSYLDTRFYGKATFTGNFTLAANAALVQEIKTVEVKMDGGSVACIMKCRLAYSRSGKEEFLEGEYTSGYEKTDPLLGISKGGNCGGGTVFLRKVTTSDFYVEPFLRNKKIATLPKDEIPKTPTARKPAANSPVRSNPVPKPAAPGQETTTKRRVEKPSPVQTEVRKPDDIGTARPSVLPNIPAISLTIRERKNELIKTITIENREVEISLYDNGEIDDDTVSIYQNNVLILANKRLSNKPITYKLKFDDANPEQTLVMVAENLGRIPPNTSLMIIQDGDKRYQVNITSTEQKNAMVRFRYSNKSSD